MHTKSRSEFLRNPLFITISPVTYDIASAKNTECRAHIRMGRGWFRDVLGASTYLQVSGDPVNGLTLSFTDAKPESRRKGWYQLRHYEPYVTTTVTLPRGEVPADEMEMNSKELDDYNISVKYKGEFRPHFITPPKPVKTGPVMSVPGIRKVPASQVEMFIGEQKLPPMDLTGIDTTSDVIERIDKQIMFQNALGHLQDLREAIKTVNRLTNEIKGLVIDVVDNTLKARIDL